MSYYLLEKLWIRCVWFSLSCAAILLPSVCNKVTKQMITTSSPKGVSMEMVKTPLDLQLLISNRV